MRLLNSALIMGEIAYTTSLTRPDVAILNNVMSHVEGFGLHREKKN